MTEHQASEAPQQQNKQLSLFAPEQLADLVVRFDQSLKPLCLQDEVQAKLVGLYAEQLFLEARRSR